MASGFYTNRNISQGRPLTFDLPNIKPTQNHSRGQNGG